MVYLINCFVMRSFAFKNPDYIKNEVVPELVEEHPCYQQSVYDTVMYDESPDGDLIQFDMTQILLNQEKYRRLLGDMNVQNYIKRLRKYLFQQLGKYETLHFYAVGEYGPVHFRPHYHLLLFTNSEKVSEVLRYCHDKSWKFGRSDFQIARGGA